MYTKDTIVAIATPQGNGGIGIVRISGVNAYDCKSITNKHLQPAMRLLQISHITMRLLTTVLLYILKHPSLMYR